MMLALYPLFVVFSFLMPRDKKIWVFGCRKGYLDNTKYFFEYASSQERFNCYWLANSNEELLEVRGQGYTAVLKKSLVGYWISARAGMSFICTGFTDVNRVLSLRSHVVNFWHGTPIKKLYFDSELYSKNYNNLKSKIVIFLHKKLLRFLIYSTDFYYASNSFERKIVTSSARMPFNKSLALGAPRFDAIRGSESVEVLDEFRGKHKKIFLYAPTWRDDGKFSDDFKLLQPDFLKLNQVLQELDAILLVKPHFNSRSEQFKDLGLLSTDRIIYSEDIGLSDINDIYKYIDILITDVSSALFDYLIFNRPVLVFMPDCKEYASSNFGIYDYFSEVLLNYSLLNWSDLIEKLAEEENSTVHSVELFGKIAEEVSGLESVNQAIYDDIVERFTRP